MSAANCPACGEPTVAGASFCEACGADLPSRPACVSCGAHAVEGDYCLECGHRQPGLRDHLEQRDGRVVGVTDKGHRHHGNEDALALADTDTGRRVLVVCDGVSTTDRSDEASQAAAEAAAAVLVSVGAPFDPAAGFVAAVQAAQEAVTAVPIDAGAQGSPSCTFVAAVVEPVGDEHHLHVGWLGDSRAYWVGAQAELLTHDHSFANELVAAGRLDPADAMSHPQAHTITRFLGADAFDLEPGVVSRRVRAPGTVVVCSDGLWNYAPDAEVLAVRPEWGIADPAERAAALTRFALDSGGHDNITVVMTDVESPDSPDSPDSLDSPASSP